MMPEIQNHAEVVDAGDPFDQAPGLPPEQLGEPYASDPYDPDPYAGI